MPTRSPVGGYSKKLPVLQADAGMRLFVVTPVRVVW
jgi:hypothetical protein